MAAHLHLAQLEDVNNNIRAIRQATRDILGCWTVDGEVSRTSPEKDRGREWYWTQFPVQHTRYDGTLTEERIMQAREVECPRHDVIINLK